MFNFKYKLYNFYSDIGTMTPIQYIRTINMLEKFCPKRICELGTGVSTLIFDIYCKKNSSVRYSIEHDEMYNKHSSIIMFPLKEKTQFNIGECVYNNCTIYNGFDEWLKQLEKFDFVLIDGANDGLPINHLHLDYSRIQTLSFVVLDKLSDNSIVMFHDSERDIAKNTLNLFEQLLKEKGFNYSKEIVVEEDKEVSDYNIRTLGVCPELTIYKLWK